MNALIDEKVRAAVWQTKIPIKIDMAIEDINDTEKPSSLFVLNTFNFVSSIFLGITILRIL